MKKIFTIVLAVFLLTVISNAQSIPGSIKGKIIGNSNPIEAASISLLNIRDSGIIKRVTSNKMGSFNIQNFNDGEYLLNITAVGYEPYFSSITIKHPNNSVDISPINLIAEAKNLKEVVVTSSKTLIENKPGKTIVNVDASPTNSGISALDLLEKSPGISVDKDGNIALRGKQGVMILLDGKPSYLSGADLLNLLKNMQSNQLDQIEIMTNPPAKYDAAGNSGIINIKTKKINAKGTNGNISLAYTQGIYGRSNNSININHRNNKINLFGSYGISTYEGFNNIILNRNFYKPDNITLVGSSDQLSIPHYSGKNHNAKIGLDYFLNKKNIFGLVVNSNFSNGKEDPESASNIRNADRSIIYSLKSNSINSSAFSSISTNINYKHTFDTTGKELTGDIDYVFFNKNNSTLLTTNVFDGNGHSNGFPVILKGVIPASIDIYSGKIDYINPLSKTSKLEAGVKSSIVNTDNRVDYTRNSGGNWAPDSRSNHFIYNENINAAYATFTTIFKKVNFIAGLRIENTVATGTQVINDSTFKRNYTNLFPNIGFGFDAGKKHQINLSYSRRINRPDYDDLNPFTFFLDSLTYGQGNPYLLPQISNILEGSHSFNRWLTTTINYQQTNNVITQLLKQDTEKKITYQTKENVSKMQQVGLAVMVNKSITKWWNTNVFVNVYNNHYKGMYLADPINIQFTTFSTNVNNSFTFKKGWGAELSGFYRGKGAEGLLIAREMYAINAGITKQVLKKKGSVRLSVRDIFLTQQFSGIARYSDVDVSVASRRDSRQVNLNFTYRFGKTSFAPARKKTGGSSEEQNRVNGGGNG